MGQRPWLNYHHLLYFKTIASEGGIAKAAKKLRLGQPTLSTQLKQFEDSIGHPLFDRAKRQLQLTEAGRLVLGYANEIFKLGDEMLDALDDRHLSNRLLVQVGVMDSISKQLTLEIFRSAQSSFNCSMTIIEGSGDDLLRELKAHRLDLVISNYPPPPGEATGYFAKSIGRMSVVVAGSEKFQGLKKNFPESLKAQPFILPTAQSKLRHDVDHFFKLHDIYGEVLAEVQDTSLQLLLCQQGVGLLPIAMASVGHAVNKRELFVLGKLDGVYEDLWMIAGQRRIENPVAAAIMKNFRIET